MTFPATTAFFAGLFALIFLGLSGWVMAGRLQTDTLHGDGGNAMMIKRMRSQANFAEYVPFGLLLIGIYEAGGGSHGVVEALLIILVIARLLHPVGMLAPKNSPQQFACRGGGILATFGVILAAAILLLIRGG